jgi:hypothetical protein
MQFCYISIIVKKRGAKFQHIKILHPKKQKYFLYLIFLLTTGKDFKGSDCFPYRYWMIIFLKKQRKIFYQPPQVMK